MAKKSLKQLELISKKENKIVIETEKKIEELRKSARSKIKKLSGPSKRIGSRSMFGFE